MTASRGRAPPRGPRVYWAEDALDDQFLIRQSVNQAADAPEIAFFEDGAALLEAVEARRPDLVVLDINMPVLDGIGALRRLRSRDDTRDIPAVLFSTARHDRDVAASRELRVLDFVQKPSHFDDFSAAVRRVLGMAGAAGSPPPAGEPRLRAHRASSWRASSRPSPMRD